MKAIDLNAINVSDWRTEPGSLENLNAKLKSPLKIVPTAEHGGDTHFDGHRVALSKGGEPMAIEYELLNIHCLVSPKIVLRK